jgi:hypothetical protein
MSALTGVQLHKSKIPRAEADQPLGVQNCYRGLAGFFPPHSIFCHYHLVSPLVGASQARVVFVFPFTGRMLLFACPAGFWASGF